MTEGMSEKRFGAFENNKEMYDLLEVQANVIEDLECENIEIMNENEQLKKENEELKNKISFLKKRIKCNNKIGLGHYVNMQNKKKLLLDEWGEKNEIIKKEKGKEFYPKKLVLKYVINYSTGEANKISEETVWEVKE